MPGNYHTYEDGWNDGFSNVVCVKTKSLNAPRNEEPTSVQVRPILRTRYINNFRLKPPVVISDISNEVKENYNNVSSVAPSIYRYHETTQAPIVSKSIYYVTQLPPRPQRHSVGAAVSLPRRVATPKATTLFRQYSYSPVEVKHYPSSFPHPSVSNRVRSSSLPPPVISTARRYSVCSTDYARNTSGLRYPMETGNVGMEGDFRQLRERAQDAKNKLGLHKSLLDRYLPGSDVRQNIYLPGNDIRPNTYYKPSDLHERLPNYERYRSSSVFSPRRASISGAWPVSGSRRASTSGFRSAVSSRASSMERSPDTSFKVTNSSPKVMSEARRKIRQVLFDVSGNADYLSEWKL